MSEIIIERFIEGSLQNNIYVVSRNGRGFIVDPGCGCKKIDDYLLNNNILIEAVLLTHGHFDHCMQAKHYKSKDAKIYIQKEDADKLETKKNLSLIIGEPFNYTTADVTFAGGETLDVAGIAVKTLHTPGHSKGGACYLVDEANAMFSGDTLFKLSYGRTDFFDGDFDELVGSIKLLFSLDKNYTVYTGHGNLTELDYERRNNPINLEAEF